jgi:hypothetical protein
MTWIRREPAYCHPEVARSASLWMSFEGRQHGIWEQLQLGAMVGKLMTPRSSRLVQAIDMRLQRRLAEE